MAATLTAVLWVMMLHVSRPAPVNTVVNSTLGPIKGFKVTVMSNQPYWAFLGIPYAKPPVGKLRFAKPQPLPYSETVIDATRFGNPCLQSMLLLSNETASEDCLFLNVYTKDLRSSSKKVLVWIHGGGFLVGSSLSYNPGSIVTNEDIIVVTVNYRLGIFGFLSTEDSASAGNFGLWDQVLAMEWVKHNIEAFGGDPNDITISGESAGGASVSLLSISPVTKGLFTKVYSHSGFATSAFAQYNEAKSDAINLAKSLNCPQENTRDLIDCLRSKPASYFIANINPIKTTFAPRVDGELIPSSPKKLIKDCDYLKKIGFYQRDYFVAVNNNENTVISQRYYSAKEMIYSRHNGTKRENDVLWKKMIVASNVAERFEIDNPRSNMVDRVAQWYYDRNVLEDGYLNLLADVNFYIPAFDILDAASQNPLTKIWLLYFNYYPSYFTGSVRGMTHGLDVIYWFDIPLLAFDAFLQVGVVDDFSETDIKLKKKYSSIVANFVKGEDNIAMWPTYSADSDYYLDFNSHSVVMKHLARDTRRLWQKELQEMLDRF